MRNTNSVLPTAVEVSSLLEQATNLITNDLNKEWLAANEGDVVELARAFLALRLLKDALETLDKAFSKLFESAKTTSVPEKYEKNGVPSVNLDEGYRVTVAHLVRASTKIGMKDAAIAWLRENKLESIVTENINASTLSAVARTLMEENKELPEELFNVVVINNTSVTKTK